MWLDFDRGMGEVREDTGIRFLSPEESREAFQRLCQRELGISAEEFVQRFKAGEYDGKLDEDPKLMYVAMLLPWWDVRPEVADAVEASWGQNEEGYRKLGNT